MIFCINTDRINQVLIGKYSKDWAVTQMDKETIKYRQMCFDIEGNIRQETYVFHREMTPEEQENYENLVADADQMTIFDFLSE